MDGGAEDQMNVPAQKSVRGSHLVLLTILLVALALRLHGLSMLAFEQDELYTLRDALDFGASSTARGGPGIWGRPVYYLLQHALLQIGPATPLFLRLPALVFGVLGVWATWKLARSAFGVTAGWVAAILVAISPWHLYASQFARYWTLVYLLATLVYLLLPRAIDTNRTRDYLIVLVPLLLGAFTHPTFLFPIIGVTLAVTLVSRQGTIGWRWPTRRAWSGLWGPFLFALSAAYLILKTTGSEGGLSNWGGRGLAPTLLLVPAIVQWANPAIVVAALAGALLLLRGVLPGDRRWAAIGLLGASASLGLMLAAAFRTDVYADYAISMLPLVYVTIGAAVQRIDEALQLSTLRFPVGAAAVLVASVLPGTVSHLLDGTRFDYRPTYGYITQHGGDELVVGWPMVLQRFYAPNLSFIEMRGSPSFLNRTLASTGGFWVVASHHRNGMIGGGDDVERWIGMHCQERLVTERPRLDYRNYRVTLHWCGDRAPAEPQVARRDEGRIRS